MNRTIQFGDRRPLEPRMDYCRLDYEFNRDAVETLNLTIQIFDQSQTQFLQRYSGLTPAQADAVIQQVLEQGWSNVLTQKFQDWAICYLQRPKVANQPQVMAAANVALADSTSFQAKVESALPQTPQTSARKRRNRARSHSSSFWKKARSVGSGVAAVGLAAGAIALGLKSAQILAPIQGRAIAALEQRVKHHQHRDPIEAEATEPPVSSVAQPITAIDPLQGDPFQQAVVLAEQAVLEGRVANSADDWKDLAMQWHEAARLMKQVPTSDERYTLAQNRAVLYADHREQSLIETALHSVVFPIENRQHISAASLPAASSPDVSFSSPSSDLSDRATGNGTGKDAAMSEKPSDPSPTISAIAPSPAASPDSCQTTFDRMIEPILTAPSYRAGQWGLYAQSLSSGNVLYQHNGDDFFVPASNIKLYTTAAAVTWVEQAQAQRRADQALTQTSGAPSSNVTNTVVKASSVPAIASSSVETVVSSSTDLDSDFPVLIQNANLFSNNWSAEILLEKMGGPTAVKELLDDVGIDPIGYHQADGSGLSRSNLVTPQSLVETLVVMHNRAGAETFFGTLPLAGQRGTLQNRFLNTIAYGKVRAKTGTLMGVRSLSGYLEHPVHGRVAFSIVVNYPGHSGYGLNSPIDQMVVQLMQLGNCSANL